MVTELGRRMLITSEVGIPCITIFATGLFAGFLAGRKIAVPVAPPRLLSEVKLVKGCD